jgi:hypothetical protein
MKDGDDGDASLVQGSECMQVDTSISNKGGTRISPFDRPVNNRCQRIQKYSEAEQTAMHVLSMLSKLH